MHWRYCDRIVHAKARDICESDRFQPHANCKNQSQIERVREDTKKVCG